MKMKSICVVCAMLAGGSVGAFAQASPDTSATPAARASAPGKTELSRADRQFLKDAAEYSMAEIEASKLAESKATSADVKSFAKQMLEDHQKTADELKQLAETKGYKLPDSPSMMQRAALKLLAGSDGDKFDKRYAERYGVKAHEDTVKMFRKEASEAKDSDVKSFAQNLVPKLEQHLSMARTLEATVAPTAAGRADRPARSASAASK